MNEDAPTKGLTHIPLSHINTTTTTIPLKRKQGAGAGDDISTEAISCICGFTYDDGFSIACDDCSRWCHAACFNIVEGEVPEEWRCWECVPMVVDRERAIKLQSMRARQMSEQRANLERAKRRSSPGVDRKHRRVSAPAIEGSNNTKRKRRASMLQQPTAPAQNEDEHIDIDEPWIHSYVHISEDIVPHQDTRDKLRRHAQQWRGVTALSPSDPLPNTSIQPLDNSAYSHLSYTNPLVRPPSYGIHTTHPIPSERLITPYTSTITPSAAYLSDPLNAYAHLGMPKPFVHLMGPPLDLTLDSRIAGDKGRFVRSGCRPNAVLRPVLCPSDRARETLSFGVFALRDLKANEEVVLGWEWDDGNAVHNLPALIESPYAFPPGQLHHFRNQMSNILHTLASTFTTCACGARAKDCALTQMAAFVDAQTPPVSPSVAKVDLGPLIGNERGFRTRERVPFSGGMSGVEMWEETAHARQTDDGDKDFPMRSSAHSIQHTASTSSDPHNPHRRSPPLSVGTSNPHHELRPPDPGLSDMDVNIPEKEEKMPPKMRKRWMHRESDALREVNGMSPNSPAGSATSLGSIGPATPIDVGLNVKSFVEDDESKEADSDESNDMPPPPMPAALDPTTISSVSIRPKAGGHQRRQQPRISHLPSPTSSSTTPAIASPSAFFAQLSLQSPLPLSPQLSAPTHTDVRQRPSSQSPPGMTWSPFRRICDDTEEGTQPTREEARGSSPRQSPPPPPPRPPSPHSSSTPGPSIIARLAEIASPPTPTTPMPMTVDVDRQASPLPHTGDISASPPELPHDSPTPSSSGGSHPPSPSANPGMLNGHVSPLPQPHAHLGMALSPPPPPQPLQMDESRECVEPNDHYHQQDATIVPPRPPTPPPLNEPIPPTLSQDTEEKPPPLSPRPPPQKVRLSLQDFARRRRQMKEAGGAVEHAGMEAKENLGVGVGTGEVRREGSKAEARDTPEVGKAEMRQEDGSENESRMEAKDDEAGTMTTEGMDRALQGQLDEKMDITLDGHPPADTPVDIAPPRSWFNTHVPMAITHLAKAEILDDLPIPHLGNEYSKTPTLFSRISPSTSIQSSAPSQHTATPTPPPPEFDPHSRRPSHEDGEILNPTTPDGPFLPKRPAYIPRSHTPPTRPRSFHASPTLSPSVNPRRPSNPSHRSPVSQQSHPPPPSGGTTNPPPTRPLPSGPRALRCAGSSAGGGGGSSYAPSSYSSRSVSGPYTPIPRGPSADRDWDRERERAWQPPPRSRWSSGAGGWSR